MEGSTVDSHLFLKKITFRITRKFLLTDLKKKRITKIENIGDCSCFGRGVVEFLPFYFFQDYIKIYSFAGTIAF